MDLLRKNNELLIVEIYVVFRYFFLWLYIQEVSKTIILPGV